MKIKKIQVQFKWFDIWVGIYIDVKNKTIYILPFPMIVVKIILEY